MKTAFLGLALWGIGANCSQVVAYDNSYEAVCPCKDRKPPVPAPAPGVP